MGENERGDYLSPEERKRQFKLAKLLPSSNGVSPEDVKPDTQAEMGSDKGKKDTQAEMGSDEDKRDRIVQFLNVDVKDKIDADIQRTTKDLKFAREIDIEMI